MPLGPRWAYSLGLLAVVGAAVLLPRLQDAPAGSRSGATAALMDSGVAAEPEQGPDGYWRINFSTLTAFDYQTPGADSFAALKPVPGRMEGIPDNIRQFHGRPVRLEGFMMPLAMNQDGSVKEFLIMRSVLTCCYGATPMPTEWVVVKPGPNAPKVLPTMDVPLFFFGKLQVGELYRDDLFAGIYELELDRVASP